MLWRWFSKRKATRDLAKKRLQLVLIHDRTSLSREVIDLIRRDIIRVITNYVEVDEGRMEVSIERIDDTTAGLVINIPILSVKRGTALHEDGKRQNT